MTNATENAHAGWYPVDGGIERYWNGQVWTDQTRPAAPAAAVSERLNTPGTMTPAAKDATVAKVAWYRRGWVIGLGALVVGVGIGSAGAGGASDPKTSSAYKDLSSQLADAQKQASTAQDQLATVQGNLPSREEALKDGQAQLKQAQVKLQRAEDAVSSREKSVAKRERAVGIVEHTIAQNTVSGDGMYKVGVDMKAGTYKSNGSAGCYYAVLNSSDTNDIGTNNLSNGPVFVTLSAGKYFETEDCADWTLQQ